MVEANGEAEQVIGREAETATLFGMLSVKSYVVAGGFRPRQLRRWTASLKPNAASKQKID